MAKFKRGDTVKLKSGGPAMTVASAAKGDEVECHWFDAKLRLVHSTFHEEELEAGAPNVKGFTYA